VTHADNSKGTFEAFKETLFAYTFDLGGLVAGFIIASQLGIFHLSPWAIAIYPAILSAKGVIGGLLSGRMGTALHLGTVYPRFFRNTKSFYKLIEALIVLTMATSAVMSLVSLVFGSIFWGAAFADFFDILSVIVATMALGLILSLVTIKVAFVSFKRGLDPDIMVYPVMSTVADIFITICYLVVLNLFFIFSYVGKYLIIVIGLAHLILVLYIFPKNVGDQTFVKTLKESLFTIMFVAVIVNITGTFLKNISAIVENRREIYMVYPALIDTVGDVGSVIGSTATTKLALGLLTPKFSSIRNHARTILSAWVASIVIFVVLAVLSPLMNNTFSLSTVSNLISILLIANFIAVAIIVLMSYAVSILTFKKGLDPDNFVIPIESSSADSVMSLALLITLFLVG
jgi:mgtE-like transporter